MNCGLCFLVGEEFTIIVCYGNEHEMRDYNIYKQIFDVGHVLYLGPWYLCKTIFRPINTLFLRKKTVVDTLHFVPGHKVNNSGSCSRLCGKYVLHNSERDFLFHGVSLSAASTESANLYGKISYLTLVERFLSSRKQITYS